MVETEKIKEKFGAAYSVDEETFVMGVHHVLADQIAQRFAGRHHVLDVCAGAGMMTIAISRYADKVTAVDIDPEHLEQARTNVARAGRREQVSLVHDDALQFLANAEDTFDAAFLDPDWAPTAARKQTHVQRLGEMTPSAADLFHMAHKITENICLRLPYEIDHTELEGLPSHELELLELEGDPKFYCAYFGDLRRE